MRDQADPEAFWFLNNHVSIPVSKADDHGGVTVTIHTVPFDDAPPLHVHQTEDEIFHILDGEVRFRVGDRPITAKTGDTLLAPRGVPHGFRVASPHGAKMLIVTQGSFEALIRSVGRPALWDGLPEATAPTAAIQADLAAKCAANGIEILGPPIA